MNNQDDQIKLPFKSLKLLSLILFISSLILLFGCKTPEEATVEASDHNCFPDSPNSVPLTSSHSRIFIPFICGSKVSHIYEPRIPMYRGRRLGWSWGGN